MVGGKSSEVVGGENSEVVGGESGEVGGEKECQEDSGVLNSVR